MGNDTAEHTREPVRRMSDAVSRFIRDVGFPIAICIYLILDLRPQIEGLRSAIERQTIIMETRLK